LARGVLAPLPFPALPHCGLSAHSCFLDQAGAVRFYAFLSRAPRRVKDRRRRDSRRLPSADGLAFEFIRVKFNESAVADVSALPFLLF